MASITYSTLNLPILVFIHHRILVGPTRSLSFILRGHFSLLLFSLVLLLLYYYYYYY